MIRYISLFRPTDLMQVGWSLAKRHWCCAEYMVACPQDSFPNPGNGSVTSCTPKPSYPKGSKNLNCKRCEPEGFWSFTIPDKQRRPHLCRWDPLGDC